MKAVLRWWIFGSRFWGNTQHCISWTWGPLVFRFWGKVSVGWLEFILLHEAAPMVCSCLNFQLIDQTSKPDFLKEHLLKLTPISWLTIDHHLISIGGDSEPPPIILQYFPPSLSIREFALSIREFALHLNWLFRLLFERASLLHLLLNDSLFH